MNKIQILILGHNGVTGATFTETIIRVARKSIDPFKLGDALYAKKNTEGGL